MYSFSGIQLSIGFFQLKDTNYKINSLFKTSEIKELLFIIFFCISCIFLRNSIYSFFSMVDSF